MRFLAGTAILLCLAFPVAPTAAAERVALVIGVDRYDALPASAQLRVAVSDAKLLATTLTSLPKPFAVELLENADRESVVSALDRFVTEAKGAECAIVYFAGHGIEFHGENYLLLRDTEIDAAPDESVRRVKDRFYYETLAMRKVLEDLDETGASLKLVILDACRNNPIDLEGPGGTRSLVGSQGGLGRVTAPSGMLISYSADAGEEANDGLFTAVLAKHLTVPGRSIMEIFAMTRSEVRERAEALAAGGQGVRHEPAEYSKLDPGALAFAFVPGERPSEPVAWQEPKPTTVPPTTMPQPQAQTTPPADWTPPAGAAVPTGGTTMPPAASMGGAPTGGAGVQAWTPPAGWQNGQTSGQDWNGPTSSVSRWSQVGRDLSKPREQTLMEVQVALAEVNAKMDTDRGHYREALNVINTLTHNKRRPVVQGSREYHQCVAASKVISEIETGAPALKAEKTRLEAVLTALGAPVGEGDSNDESGTR